MYKKKIMKNSRFDTLTIHIFIMTVLLLSQLMPELVKDVAGDEPLHCLPWQATVVGELLQEAQGVHHVVREVQRLLPERGVNRGVT